MPSSFWIFPIPKMRASWNKKSTTTKSYRICPRIWRVWSLNWRRKTGGFRILRNRFEFWKMMWVRWDLRELSGRKTPQTISFQNWKSQMGTSRKWPRISKKSMTIWHRVIKSWARTISTWLMILIRYRPIWKKSRKRNPPWSSSKGHSRMRSAPWRGLSPIDPKKYWNWPRRSQIWMIKSRTFKNKMKPWTKRQNYWHDLKKNGSGPRLKSRPWMPISWRWSNPWNRTSKNPNRKS